MSNGTIQYQPLLQATLSDEEDDVLEFDRDDQQQNGSIGKKEAIPLRNLGSPASQSRAPRDGLVVRSRQQTRRKLIIVVLLVCVLVIGAMSSAVLVYLNQEFNHGIVQNTHFSPYGDWTLFFNQSETESSVTLVDVDGDGLEDVLVGVTSFQQFEAVKNAPGHTMKQRCLALRFPFPCTGQVVALRGYDGKELWRTWLYSMYIFINCDFDVNKDNKRDCILTGRQGSVQAVDLATGDTHWIVDSEEETWRNHFEQEFTVFRALSLPDVDEDGIKDILVTHSGNQSKESEDHDRAPGRVIFLSGASGKPLGRYLDLPNSRETYMSPIRHVAANGSSYILLGSGGETVSGDLMIVSEADLIHSVMDDSPPHLRTLFQGSEKGVMIAPVLADLTNDGTPDILMSAFEGVIALYDGETLQQLWTKEFPGMESYSTPALGDFDGDGVLDLLVLWGHGEWDEYDYAIVYLLSGTDGRVLWQTQCQMVQMYSSLTLKTTGPHDLFLFRTMGQVVNTPPLPAARGKHMTKRHFGSHASSDNKGQDVHDNPFASFRELCDQEHKNYADDHLTCNGDLSRGKVQVLLLDKDTADSPTVVFNISSQPHHYNLPVNGSRQHCHDVSPINKKLLDLCVVFIPRGLTGAVGDVDGDGVADLIQLDSLKAEIINDLYDELHSVGDVILTRHSLDDVLKGKPVLLPMSEQPWRQFMGSAGDNVYRNPK